MNKELWLLSIAYRYTEYGFTGEETIFIDKPIAVFSSNKAAVKYVDSKPNLEGAYTEDENAKFTFIKLPYNP